MARRVLASLAMTALSLPGCATPLPEPASRADFSDNAPRYTEAHRGLELRVWLAEDDANLGAALADLETVPGGEAARVWRDAGLRVLRVNSDDLEGLRRRIIAGGSLQSRWVGQPSASVRLVQGPGHPDLPAVRAGDAVLPLDRGSVDFAGRAWVLPEPSGSVISARLAVELELRARPAGPGSAFGAILEGSEGAEVILLQFAATLSVGEALLVLAEDPEVEWARMGGGAVRRERAPIRVPGREAPAGPDGSGAPLERADEGVEAGPARVGGGAVALPGERAGDEFSGPLEPALPTLGSLLLPPLPGPARGQERRAVLVLVPHLPVAADGG